LRGYDSTILSNYSRKVANFKLLKGLAVNLSQGKKVNKKETQKMTASKSKKKNQFHCDKEINWRE
jgi:hypothetical protein